jgi:hypothetical protein
MLGIVGIIDKVLGLVSWFIDFLDKKRAERDAMLKVEHDLNEKRAADAKASEATDADARTADIAVLRERMRKYQRRV